MFVRPTPLPYDMDLWQQKPFAERLQMVCRAWALQGYGAPLAVYGAYLVKIAGYVAMWFFFCSRSDAGGPPSSVGSWWFSLEALTKAVLWSMLYEGLGFGCGSGPLTGRYFPPVGGFLHFLWPGTTKLPLFAKLPVLGGTRRSLLDVFLYAAHCALLLRALLAPEVTPALLLPTLVLLPILGLSDKTIFLASRAEHYWVALLCLFSVDDAVAGLKWVWFAIWVWAAISKMTHHFPTVIAVMTSNNPFLRSAFIRKRLYRNFPDDLRPSTLAVATAHIGTVLEALFPLLLIASTGGVITQVGLVVMLVFHLYITSNVPMAVPIEWNVVMVYGAFLLFGEHAEVVAWHMSHSWLAASLVVALFLVPLVGNFVPRYVSFLLSMRYYAGNWPYSIWLFRADSSKKLEKLKKVARSTGDQLRLFYDDKTARGLVSLVIAFRCMHLHGRALQALVPQAVDDIDDYEWLDGELIAGQVLGWNFGDGHLHDHRLLAAIQAQCGFEPGELRCIFVESQPLFGRTLAWRIQDAATGLLHTGTVNVNDLRQRQPWPAVVG